MHTILEAESSTDLTKQLKENRNALRQMARRVSLSIRLADGQPFDATLQDLSRRGMRLRSRSNVRCGETITIGAVEGTDLAAVDCRIMRVQLVGSDDNPMFEYGLQICQGFREQGHHWFLHFCFGGARERFPRKI